MAQTKILLVRHGQTIWNQEEKMQGLLNSPLTPTGVHQAELLGQKLATEKIAACYASDLERAQQTAQLIINPHQLPVVADPSLRELNMGLWEGQSKATNQENYPESWHNFWHAPDLYVPIGPGAQTFSQLQENVTTGFKELVARHPNQTILIVSHRITVKVLLASLLNQPLSDLWLNGDINPTSLSVIEMTDGQPEIVTYGDTSHYE